MHILTHKHKHTQPTHSKADPTHSHTLEKRKYANRGKMSERRGFYLEMIMTGMRGTEVKGQFGSHGFVFHFGMQLGQMLFLQQGIEEEKAASDASAFGDQMIRPFGGFQALEIETSLIRGESAICVYLLHVTLLAKRSAEIQRALRATEKL